MYAVVSSVNSHIVELRPTGIYRLLYNTEIDYALRLAPEALQIQGGIGCKYINLCIVSFKPKNKT